MKIVDLPELTQIGSTDWLVAVHNGVTYKIQNKFISANPLPPGAIIAFNLPTASIFTIGGGVAASPFWVPCDGGTYTGTGDINGNAWSFVAPDLRGRTIVAAGTGTGLSARTLGDVLGEERHQLTLAELASHKHTSNYDGQFLGSTSNPVYYFTNSAGYFFPMPYGFSINNAGGDQPHNNMQPSYVATVAIRTPKYYL